MATYSKTSPYYKTGVFDKFLDVMVNRDVPSNSSDAAIVISAAYHQRPDLLAYDLYDDARLWWIFAVRNPNTLEDPVFDFTTGTVIYVPTPEVLTSALGL